LAKFRTLACIGCNRIELARLRILLGEAASRLDAQWKLGSPEHADVLLLAGDADEVASGRLVAAGRGVRCVDVRDGALSDAQTLPTGFGVDELVRVLSSSVGPGSRFKSLDAHDPAFFETTGVHAGARDPNLTDIEALLAGDDPQNPVLSEPVDLDRFLQRESEEYTLERIVPGRLDERTSVEPASRERPSTRAEVRGSERTPYARPVNGQSPKVFDPDPPASAARKHAAFLETFLVEGRLMAPCQLILQGTEPLILDPKHRQYRIVGDLASAEPYAGAQFLESDFERLTTRELERWHALCEGRPYLRLSWLLALRRGDGWLPRHLDPGGSYRVRRMLDLDSHFDTQIRIIEVLQDWRRLHEVAAHAGVDMQSVFNCVAAFDAIGWLEWRPRERFRNA